MQELQCLGMRGIGRMEPYVKSVSSYMMSIMVATHPQDQPMRQDLIEPIAEPSDTVRRSDASNA